MIRYRSMAQNENAATAPQASEVTQGSSQNANVAASAQESSIVKALVNEENNAAATLALIPLQRVPHNIFAKLGHTVSLWLMMDMNTSWNFRTCNGKALKMDILCKKEQPQQRMILCIIYKVEECPGPSILGKCITEYQNGKSII